MKLLRLPAVCQATLLLAKHRLTGQCRPQPGGRSLRSQIATGLSECLRLLTPCFTGTAHYVWTGEVPPRDESLGDFRAFTAEASADGPVCRWSAQEDSA